MAQFATGFYEAEKFNRFTNLDGVEWRIIDAFVKSDSRHAKAFWKMLNYNTEDCLTRPELSNKEKYSLIYRDNGVSDQKKIFLQPFLDDAWTAQSSRVNIYVDSIEPKNYVVSTVNIAIEVVVHNKINNIYSLPDNGQYDVNPSEYGEDGSPLIYTKSRATTLAKAIIAELNGRGIAGVGMLQLNKELNSESKVVSHVWNNKSYLGFKIVFSTLMSGASDNSAIGY